MFRKTILAIAAVAAVAAAGYTSADAMPVKKVGPPVSRHSEHHDRHDRGFFFGSGFAFAPLFAEAYEPCWRKVWVKTPHGLRRRLVDVCEY